MFTNQKINYTALFLVFCVASSKSLIIYNEEILVALSFALFILFCLYYLGDTVKDSLNERSSTIRFQLEEFHRLKEDSLQQLSFLHNQIKQAKTLFPSLDQDVKRQLSYTSDSNNQRLQLHNRYCEQIQQKLTHFQSSKAALQQELQKTIASSVTFFQKDKRNLGGKDSRLVTEIIRAFSSLFAHSAVLKSDKKKLKKGGRNKKATSTGSATGNAR